MKKIFLLLSILISANANAQFRKYWDSVKYDLNQDRSWFICLDGKNSIVRDLKLKMFGLQSGYTYNNRTNIFLGYYGSYNNESIILENPTAPFGKIDSNTVYARYKLSYLNIGTESYFVNSKRWRMAIPITFGIGSGTDEKFKRNATFENVFEKSKHTIMPLEIGFYINYKIKWWVWAGAGLGSRFALNASAYSGSYYTYGISLRFGEMYSRARDWYKKQQK
ncbi:MAG: hypothetical protein IT245_07450 [Bacteroidia bacterium]|nr:hypothetical protein [Bacteroidia bacterium]